MDKYYYYLCSNNIYNNIFVATYLNMKLSGPGRLKLCLDFSTIFIHLKACKQILNGNRPASL